MRLPAIYLLLFLILSCSEKKGEDKIVNASKDVDSLMHDTLPSVASGSQFSSIFETVKLSNLITPEALTPDLIVKHKIKRFELTGSYNKIKEFDQFGNKIFEQYRSKTSQNEQTFKYKFDGSGKKQFVCALFNNVIIDSCEYRYGNGGMLLGIGKLSIIYNKDGFIESIDDSEEMEHYTYDKNWNLIQIFFESKVPGCGNRIDKWTGKYDNKDRLITSEEFGHANPKTEYTYSPSGQVKNKKIYYNNRLDRTCDYTYTDDLVSSIKIFDGKDKFLSESTFTYTKY